MRNSVTHSNLIKKINLVSILFLFNWDLIRIKYIKSHLISVNAYEYFVKVEGYVLTKL